MSNNAKTNSSFPFYKKWWFWAVILLLVLFVIIGSNRDDDADNTANTPEYPAAATIDTTTSSPHTEPQEKEDLYSVVDKFIALHNSADVESISNIEQMDIHGEDYKTEFRLNEFKNAVGKQGTITGGSVKIINYGLLDNDKIRLYIFADNYNTAIEQYAAIIHILDSTISDQEISEQYDSFDFTGSSSIYLGTAGYISGYIHTSYANGGPDGYEIMVDCARINFI